MIVLQAPYDLIQTTSVFPNPLIGDTRAFNATVNLKRSMTGSLYSYVKTTYEYMLEYEFILTQEKRFELINFVLAYFDQNIKLVDFDDRIWKVKIVTPQLELTSRLRDESRNVALSLRGFLING